MASVDQVFQLLKFRASKSGYAGTISSNDFNLIFPRAELRYFNKLFGDQNKYRYGDPIPPIAYPGTLKVSTSLSKFGTEPISISIDSNGIWRKPENDTALYIDSLSHYVTGTGGTSIRTFTFTSGSGYTDGVYINTPLVGDVVGTGATADITILDNVVVNVTLKTGGINYAIGNGLSATFPGGGSGFSVTVTSLSQDDPTPIKRVEKQDLSDNLYSYYEYPTEIFPIYVEYSTYIQFYPKNLITAQLTTLRKPVVTKWAYTLNGSISTLNSLVAGTGYTDGIYSNVNFIGGSGNSAQGTITVTGGAVSTVQISNSGYGYKTGDTLTATFGGGSGFSIAVASIVNARQVYDPDNSVDPEWMDTDLDEIIYMALSDIGVYLRDNELEQFSAGNSKTGGIA